MILLGKIMLKFLGHSRPQSILLQPSTLLHRWSVHGRRYTTARLKSNRVLLPPAALPIGMVVPAVEAQSQQAERASRIGPDGGLCSILRSGQSLHWQYVSFLQYVWASLIFHVPSMDDILELGATQNCQHLRPDQLLHPTVLRVWQITANEYAQHFLRPHQHRLPDICGNRGARFPP